ncbi:type III-B CRISPR-associated protein Cas10/Cmr2 [Microcoleus sp.]|uniref:type III-B CRISPR-associated protein Cas10/Cmr2 n=1 Tax=Microcoleus sp. TaxID=44472 RepID=UPI00352351B0
MTLYQRKLYTLLAQSGLLVNEIPYSERIPCLSNCESNLPELEENRRRAGEISKASDRVNFEKLQKEEMTTGIPIEVRHLISGQHRTVENLPQLGDEIIDRLNAVADNDHAKKAFWWLWRFYPEYLAQQQPDALLYPANLLIPDCPLHSYNSTVSAIAGAIPEDYTEKDADKHPYLLLFTFSPVQEFIKSSRKFLDFWAGSYLLHYLSAKLCWFIANEYGPDAVITPSLWSQEIIDALMVKEYPDFLSDFQRFQRNSDPVGRFEKGTSTSLSTAGFPNVITGIVPGKEAAKELGEKLCNHLKEQWQGIALKVRSHIRESVIGYLSEREINQVLNDLANGEPVSDSPDNPNRRDLQRWVQRSNWEWGKLWDAQIDHTWEPYWTAVPLGHPKQQFSVQAAVGTRFHDQHDQWIANQETVAPSRNEQQTPTEAENHAYKELNIGTWWANSQSRLGQAIQAVKNTRNWRIPAAPGERSTISGQFSAIHPGLNYGLHQESSQSPIRDLREGAGINSGSMQLFWGLMALVYPGLFNGSEKLNALELTKRMAWQYGGVAESLGIRIESQEQLINQVSLVLDEEDNQKIGYRVIPVSKKDIYYDRLIRFPNLSSIAAARFVRNRLPLTREYWRELACLIQTELPDYIDKFAAKTRGRAFNIPQVDRFINPQGQDGQDYNGVMFSSKWLAEDMGVKEKEQLTTLRRLVEEAHKKCKFGDSSPADWWAIIVADGDGMGKYVSGSKLNPYKGYIHEPSIDKGNPLFSDEEFKSQFDKLLESRKRMGPATHVGLNRALLDFSNRLVPYLTEKRFCGKVVYSGGDDVLAVLPLADLPEYLLCLRAAWCGDKDPYTSDPKISFTADGGYWQPNSINDENDDFCGLPNRPLFTMGKGATLSAGIVIAHKSVPLPTVLESLWSAEEDRAKEMKAVNLPRRCRENVLFVLCILELVLSDLEKELMAQEKKSIFLVARIIFATFIDYRTAIAPKDGFCFRVIYGGGNVLEASMKGHLLSQWWTILASAEPDKLSPVLYRLAEELPIHTAIAETAPTYRQNERLRLLSKASRVIMNSRDEPLPKITQKIFCEWVDAWEDWAERVYASWKKRLRNTPNEPQPVGCSIQDLAKLLRFSAFWLDKMAQQKLWEREVR